MKKGEKYMAINNQEDEDGYILYPGFAIYRGNIKDNRTVSDLQKDANVAGTSPKRSSGKLTGSTPGKPGRTKR